MTDDLIAQLEAVADGGFRTVDIEGVSFRLRPVAIVECIRLLRRFPALKAALFGGAADDDGATLLNILVDSGPEAVAALAAAASGRIGDDRLEAVIARLPDDVLIPLVSEVVALTMPDGFEAFFGRLTKMAGAAGEIDAAPVPADVEKRVRKAAGRTTRS